MICEFKTCLVLLSLSSLTTRSISCPASCRCDGTFIYCNDRDLTSIPAGIPEDATILYLQNNRISSANVPTELRGLHWVEKIYLYCNNLDEFPTNLPRNVKELHLQENNIRTITCASMAQIPHIEELHLDDNSVSAVSIEEGAFRHSSHLRLLFLSRNHLSSIPVGLPGSIEELRFDDNRVSSVSEESMQDLVNLKRLILDGNLLNNRRVGEMAFVNLTNLTELSLIRNSFTAPPVNLPGTSLERLQLQDNHISAVPPGAFGFLRQLYRLDLSGNNLSSLPQGVFDDLDNLTQLLLRNNPWHCGCRMKWTRDWLRTLPSKVSVRGLMCQSPEKLKGMAIKDLATDLFDCAETQINPILQTGTNPYTQPLPNGQWPPFVTRRPVVKGAGQNKLHPGFPPSGGRLITISVKSRGAGTVRISWKVARPVTALRLSWLKMGQGSAFGSITETIVHGDKTEYLLTALDSESLYRICLVPMETGNIYIRDETPVCIETETDSRLAYKSSTTLNREQEKWPYKKAGLPLAPIVGGVGAFLVIVALVFVCLYVHKNRALFSRRCSYSKGRRRQDDYVEAGTKKNNSILEIRDTTSFQMIPINPGIVSKEDFMIHAIFPSNGLTLCKSSNGENCNQIFRDSGIPDSDHCRS